MKKKTKKQIMRSLQKNKSVDEIVLEKYKHILLTQWVAMLKVLRDEHGYGRKRLAKFIDDTMMQIECVNDKYVTTTQILELIYEETGFNFGEYVNKNWAPKEEIEVKF